jgi:hypothetical protein
MAARLVFLTKLKNLSMIDILTSIVKSILLYSSPRIPRAPVTMIALSPRERAPQLKNYCFKLEHFQHMFRQYVPQSLFGELKERRYVTQPSNINPHVCNPLFVRVK